MQSSISSFVDEVLPEQDGQSADAKLQSEHKKLQAQMQEYYTIQAGILKELEMLNKREYSLTKSADLLGLELIALDRSISAWIAKRADLQYEIETKKATRLTLADKREELRVRIEACTERQVTAQRYIARTQ